MASWGNVGGVGALRAVGGNVGGASQKGFFFCLPEVLRKGWRGVRAFLVGPPVALATAVVAPPFFFFFAFLVVTAARRVGLPTVGPL